MSAVSEIIVREYFELHGFLVRQQRKYVAPGLREGEEIDFFVLNPRPLEGGEALPFVLSSDDLARLHRALVVVKAWHTEIFSPSMLASEPELFRFLDPTLTKQAARAFGDEATVTKILVIPSLPLDEKARAESVALLRGKGVDAILPFRTVLGHLVTTTEANRNYQKSDLLQVIRLLKNYEFLREPQLELFKPRRGRKPSRP